jgi:hypothetical protein
MWPCNLYDGDTGGINNPLRCIFSDDNLRKTYFENISRAMAQLCDVLATVMTADPNNIPLTGIWGRVEFPALQQTGNSGGQVNAVSVYLAILFHSLHLVADAILLCAQIFAVDAEGKNTVSVWNRTIPNPKKRTLVRRQQRGPTQCFDASQLQSWFGTVPW